MSEIRSRPQTAEYDEGHERTFGERKPGQRGRWVYDQVLGKLVRAEDYVPPEQALHAPIMVDRFMEGERAPDGTDVGSRQKRKAWMAATGTADYSDFEGARQRRAAELAAKARGEVKPDKALREFIGRELYKRKVII